MTVVRAQEPRWLTTWGDIEDMKWKDILLGNGASIALHRSFRYSSLLEVIKDPFCSSNLKRIDVKLFSEFRTKNFERILRVLNQSERVNRILGLPTAAHAKRYNAIREALVSAIGKVHPTFNMLDEAMLEAASGFLSRFKRIFTTNYDLLLYWAIMCNPDRFGDYFWGKVFDQNDTELRNKTAVIYLHGALFLFSAENDAVEKIKARSEDLLTRIRRKLRRGTVPVFVSEGTSEQKWAAIRRHDYLNFAFAELRNSDGNLVIFGHSLSSRGDSQLIETINKSPRKNIAYAVHKNGKSSCQLEKLKSDTKAKFSGKQLFFFDSDSLPIYG